jgi:hypothetical protein
MQQMGLAFTLGLLVFLGVQISPQRDGWCSSESKWTFVLDTVLRETQLFGLYSAGCHYNAANHQLVNLL